MSPHLRKSGFRIQESFACGIQNPDNSCLWNRKTLGFGKRNTAKGIRNPLMIAIAGINSTTSTDKESGILQLESGIHGVESRISDCLRFHYYLGRFINDILQIWTIFLLASFTLIKIQISTTFARVVSCEMMERLVRGTGEYRKTRRVQKKGQAKASIVCFQMTSWRPHLCPKTMTRRPCLCPKPALWELNSFFT